MLTPLGETWVPPATPPVKYALLVSNERMLTPLGETWASPATPPVKYALLAPSERMHTLLGETWAPYSERCRAMFVLGDS